MGAMRQVLLFFIFLDEETDLESLCLDSLT